MNNESLKLKLAESGLSTHEIIIYLYLLTKETARVKDIVKGTNTVRITVYAVLGSLMEKGLVSKLESGKNRNVFLAEPPNKVFGLVEAKIARLQRTLIKLTDSAGELQALYNERKEDKPRVVFYEGIEGLKQSRQDVMDRKPKMVYELVNIDNNPFEKNKEKERDQATYLSLGISFESIYTSQRGEVLKPVERQIKRYYAPFEEFNKINSDVAVYQNRVVLTSYLGTHKKNTVYIENQELADTFKEMFKLMKIGIESLKQNKKDKSDQDKKEK